MNRKNKPARPKKKAQKESRQLVQYILVGYNKLDDSKTGCLGIDQSPEARSMYKIVGREQAKRFPAENISNNPHFGTPQQWLEFFKDDPALANWQFHLVKYVE